MSTGPNHRLTLDQLAGDLREARKRAEQAIEGMEDGGTANLDHLVLRTGKGSPIVRKSENLLEAIVDGGGQLGSKIGTSYRLSLEIDGVGQGATNTVAMETAATYLQDRGWPVSVRYLAD